MVKVVVALAKGEEGSDGAVLGSALVVIGELAEGVSDAVDAEGALEHGHSASNGGDVEASSPITPTKTTDQSGEDDAGEEGEGDVVLMLPDEEGVALEVADIGLDSLLISLLEEPTHMGVPEATLDVVRVAVSVGVAVVSSVVQTPVKRRCLERLRRQHRQCHQEPLRRIIRTVRQQSVVTCIKTK